MSIPIVARTKAPDVGMASHATATGLMRKRNWDSFFKLHASDVELRLQVEPELGTGAKEDAKGEGGLRVDGALALDDFVDGGARDAGALGEFRLSQVEAIEEFVLEDSSRRCAKNGRRFLYSGHVENGSMVNRNRSLRLRGRSRCPNGNRDATAG